MCLGFDNKCAIHITLILMSLMHLKMKNMGGFN